MYADATQGTSGRWTVWAGPSQTECEAVGTIELKTNWIVRDLKGIVITVEETYFRAKFAAIRALAPRS